MDRTATVTSDLWTYVDQDPWMGTDITGFTVEALNGEIGTVADATYEAGGSYIVVDTGPWILAHKVLLPAGLISGVDLDGERVHVNVTKDTIQHAPEFEESTYREAGYRHDLADYYALRARGYRE